MEDFNMKSLIARRLQHTSQVLTSFEDVTLTMEWDAVKDVHYYIVHSSKGNRELRSLATAMCVYNDEVHNYVATEMVCEVIMVKGVEALLCDARVPEQAVPAGWFAYELRGGGGGDMGTPATLERHVLCDFVGTLFVRKELLKESHEYVTIEHDDIDYLGSYTTMSEFVCGRTA